MMGLQKKTFLDIPQEQRRTAAADARRKAAQLLTNPLLTPEQVATVQQHLRQIDQWELGQLPGTSPPEREPTHHGVEVVDSFTVKDGS